MKFSVNQIIYQKSLPDYKYKILDLDSGYFGDKGDKYYLVQTLISKRLCCIFHGYEDMWDSVNSEKNIEPQKRNLVKIFI